MKKLRIYCSGPLFCAEEVGGMTAISKVIENAGMQTFLPHRDGLEPYVMRFGNIPMPSSLSGIRDRVDYAIFSLDVYELIECCNAIVCNLNGRVPDEGMIVEASIAYAAGKPLVLYKNDIRAPFGGCDNAMLTSLSQGKIVRTINELPHALSCLIFQEESLVSLSSNIKEAISYGKRISKLMEVLPKNIGKQQWSEEILHHVIDAYKNNNIH